MNELTKTKLSDINYQTLQTGTRKLRQKRTNDTDNKCINDHKPLRHKLTDTTDRNTETPTETHKRYR